MYYEFYIDVYLFTNFFFDYLTLLLLREIRNRKGSIKRMAACAFFGVLGSTLFMICLKNAILYKALVHFFINPLMFFLCFRQKSIQEFLKDYGVGYLLMMLIGGCMQWLCQMTGKQPLFGLSVAALSMILTLFLGLYKSRGEETKIYDIRICQNGKELSTKGFLDTGNMLLDPYISLPVSLIAKETLAKIEGIETLSYRYIPFVSLGKKNGLVPAVTLESLHIQKKNEEIVIKPAVFAVVEEDFLKGNEYSVILNGRLW